MDKKSLRLKGISYRTSLSGTEVLAKNDSMSRNLRELLRSFPDPYLTYTAILPGELNPANAFIDSRAIFIAPDRNAPMEFDDFSAIVIPMVAGDMQGNRVGMGGGWFDRFLPRQPQAVVIGSCYDAMVLDQVPSEPHDVRVDYICTETRVIQCSVE